LTIPRCSRRLEPLAGDNAFQQQFRAVKHRNKIALARLIGERLAWQIDPGAAVRRPDQAHP